MCARTEIVDGACGSSLFWDAKFYAGQIAVDYSPVSVMLTDPAVHCKKAKRKTSQGM